MPAIPCKGPLYTFYIVTVTAREGTSKQHFTQLVTDRLKKQGHPAKVACVKERYPNPDRTKHFTWPDGECYHYHLVYHCVTRSGAPVRSRWKKLWKFLNTTDYAHSSFFTLKPKKGEDASVIFRRYIEDPKKRKEIDVDGVYESSHDPRVNEPWHYHLLKALKDPTVCTVCGPQPSRPICPTYKYHYRIAAAQGCAKCKATLARMN